MDALRARSQHLLELIVEQGAITPALPEPPVSPNGVADPGSTARMNQDVLDQIEGIFQGREKYRTSVERRLPDGGGSPGDSVVWPVVPPKRPRRRGSLRAVAVAIYQKSSGKEDVVFQARVASGCDWVSLVLYSPAPDGVSSWEIRVARDWATYGFGVGHFPHGVGVAFTKDSDCEATVELRFLG
ncbi:hypothetical protein [Actinokineospora diospyrosa]|nr:hypothetical protein [Actinokineospora diospyrosa]